MTGVAKIVCKKNRLLFLHNEINKTSKSESLIIKIPALNETKTFDCWVAGYQRRDEGIKYQETCAQKQQPTTLIDLQIATATISKTDILERFQRKTVKNVVAIPTLVDYTL